MFLATRRPSARLLFCVLCALAPCAAMAQLDVATERYDDARLGANLLETQLDTSSVNVDGFGDEANKVSKYDLFSSRKPGRYNGFKLFFHEDTDLMRPREVLRLIPRPDVVVYE